MMQRTSPRRIVTRRRARTVALLALLVGLAGCAAMVVGGYTTYSPPYRASDHALALRGDMLIVDLHADSLLWGLDLVERQRRGHVDIPRLIEGGVAAQVFGIVTKAPARMNIESNDDSSDSLALLARIDGWPEDARKSLARRVLYQAGKLDTFAARSNGRLVVVRSRADWTRYLEQRRARRDVVAGILSVEGAHALEGDLANVDRFFDAGVRMMSPSHFFDTDVGGSAHGIVKGGLTDLGRRVLQAMERRGMLVDLAHASERTITDVLALATRPVIVSHTGVRGTCDNRRNLGDDQLRAIARTGGLVGIGFWTIAVCGRDARDIAAAIRHAVDVAGAGHVALGSDFDGSVTTPFDATGLAQLIDALLERGLSEAAVRKVMGENASGLFSRLLPEG